MKKKISIVAIVCIIVAVVALIAVKASSRSEVRIAVNIPLSGPVAALSGNFPNGFKMGIEEACHEFGISPTQISVDFQDNAANPTSAVSVYRQQSIKDYDAYVVGTTESANAVVSAMPKTAEKPCFLFVYDAFMPERNPGCFRILPNFRAESKLWIKHAEVRQAKKIFMLTLDMSGTEEQFSQIIVPALRSKGIECIRSIYPAATVDFRLLARKAKECKPDLVYISGYSFHISKIISALRENGIPAEKIMCCMDFCDLTRTPEDRKKYDGVIFACPAFEVDNSNPKVEDWKKRYRQKFNLPPTYVEAFAYENACLLVKAYAENGKISYNICKNIKWNDISGKSVGFDEHNDAPAEIVIARLINGKIVKLDRGE